MPFAQPVDIGNQAIQFCGARRMTTLADNSVEAQAVNFCYDQVRRNELRRNVWGFAVRRCVLRPLSLESMTFLPAGWNSGTSYAIGALVSFTIGDSTQIWQSLTGSNTDNTPSETSAQWSLYFGAFNYEPYDSGTVYYAGEVSYIPALWVSGTTYPAGAVVTYNSLPYLSIQGSNIGETPASSPSYWVQQAWPLTQSSTLAPWNTNTQYAVGQYVSYGGGIYYALVTQSGNIPSTSPSDWALVVQEGPVAYLSLASNNSAVPAADTNWLQLSGTLTSYAPLYPFNAGPWTDRASRNAFPLPIGYLKEAPQDPKAGATNYLGSPAGRPYDDWEIENGFIISRDPSPIIFRFSADVVNVLLFDSMFCMGFAAAIAETICEEVTQSDTKLRSIRSEYAKAMTEARLINGIEQGPTEPPIDDYLSCRV